MIHTAKVLSIPGPDKPWHTGSMVGFDLETTGKNPHEARIVTASMVLLDPQGRTRAHAEWLLDPGVEMPAGAAAGARGSSGDAPQPGIDATTGAPETGATVTDHRSRGG